MKVADLLESRRENWKLLEKLCTELERSRKQRMNARSVARFASLYRAACADLALASSYQLPPRTVHYLHHLVGRAHNQLYRGRRFNFSAWAHELFVVVPQSLFHDNCLRLAFVIFWGCFLTSMYLSSSYSPRPGYVKTIVDEEQIEMFEKMYENPIGTQDRNGETEGKAAGFYILNNTGIGLQCFAAGLLFGVGGLFATVYNGLFLGAVFGYMTRVPQGENFVHFVTAHGPFELTAIVLSAAAGMRLGFSLIDTNGYSRVASLRLAARAAMPTMGAVMVLFLLAALIEGFLSPSTAPYAVKAAVAALSTGMLLFYFVVLGYPQAYGDSVV